MGDQIIYEPDLTSIQRYQRENDRNEIYYLSWTFYFIQLFTSGNTSGLLLIATLS